MAGVLDGIREARLSVRTVVPAAGTDRAAQERSVGLGMAGGRRAKRALDYSAGAHEGRPSSPRAADFGGHAGARRGAALQDGRTPVFEHLRSEACFGLLNGEAAYRPPDARRVAQDGSGAR